MEAGGNTGYFDPSAFGLDMDDHMDNDEGSYNFSDPEQVLCFSAFCSIPMHKTVKEA